MSARITINLTSDGQLEIWLNEQWRDLLVGELLALSEKSDHFHMGPDDSWEVPVSSRAYRLDDKIIRYGKVLFRTDAWDAEHYPHVLADENRT